MRCLLLCLLATFAWGQDQGPVTSFEPGQPQPFVAGGVTLTVVAEQASEGQHALRVEVPGSAQDTWPGIYLREGTPDWSDKVLLLLDVFLPGDAEQQLSLRLDDLADHKAFGSVKLKPGWNRNLGINVKAVGAGCDMKQLKQLLLYLRMPREDVTLFIDQVRWGTFEGQFNQVVHRTAPGPAPAAAKPYTLFSRPAEALVFPDTPADEPLRQLSLFAARGEREPVAISLRAGEDLPAVDLEVGELTGPRGEVLPAGAWDVTRVETLPKRFHYKSDDYLVGMPAYLAPQASPIAIPAGTTRTFWLTVQVPQVIAPGVYTGQAQVITGDQRRGVPLQVRVLPYGLPEPPGVFYGEYYRAFGKYLETADDIRRDLADMREHGMTSVGLCFGVESASFAIADGQVRFQFDGTTRFEWFMDAYRDLGFPMPVVLLSDSGQAAAGQAGAYGTPEYDHTYVAFHQALAAEAAKHGWPTIIVQPVDEPGWQTEEHRERNRHLLSLLHAAGVPTEQDGPGDDYFHNVAGPVADVWNYNGAIGGPEQIAAAKAAGKQITLYNNDVESYRPEVDRWAYGLFNWRHGLQGGFNWEYRGGYGDLFNNLDADTGDWVHRYPRTEEHPGGPSTGFEGSREGVDDRRYLDLLEGMLQRAPAGLPAAREARATLDDLRARLDDSPRVRSRATFAETLTAEQARAAGYDVPDSAAKVVVGDLKQPNGLTFAEYDTIRWLVARQCGLLQAALGMGPHWQDPGPPKVSPPAERLTDVVRSEAGGTAAVARPVVRLPILAADPTLDGTIDGDAGWTGAASLHLTLSNGAGPTELPTEAKVGLREGTLYVGFVCGEDRLDNIVAQVTEPDGPVWQDDCVEVFIDPGVTEKRFYQVVVNSLGTILRTASDGSAWKPAVVAKTALDRASNRWLAELAIPVGDLNLAPKFGFNVGRERRPTEVMELSTWSVTGGGFAQPARFGLAVIDGDVPEAPRIKPALRMMVSPGYLLTDDATTTIGIDLQIDPAVRPQAKATLRLGNEAIALPGPLAPRMTATLHIGDLGAGDHSMRLEVTAPGTEALVATAKLTRVPGVF